MTWPVAIAAPTAAVVQRHGAARPQAGPGAVVLAVPHVVRVAGDAVRVHPRLAGVWVLAAAVTRWHAKGSGRAVAGSGDRRVLHRVEREAPAVADIADAERTDAARVRVAAAADVRRSKP